ncbi:MAG TPA: NAD kinase [Burkholderiaceae bacterium]|nr:NAD kinase [Burkholderiaceae bacterium]
MKMPFRTAAVFAKTRAEGNRAALVEALNAILGIVERAGLRSLLDAESCQALGCGQDGHSLTEIGNRADVAIVLGGDGTMLSIARELASYDVPLIGINFGRLGFITDIAFDQMPGVLEQMLGGRFESDRRTLLEGEVLHAGVVALRTHALNDVVISHGVAGGMVEFTVRVNGVNMYNQRADGVILATPTGSTAYALSANGPILHPSLAGFVLVPVAPHTLSNRPIALPDDVEIEIELTEVRDASAFFDMQSFSTLAPGDIVRVRRSAHVVTLLHPAGYNYFATLRQKLHWNVMSSEEHGRA